MKIKYQILVVSLILSSILWLSLNLDQSYEIQKSIPIKFNVEKPYAISNIIPLNLDVKLKAKGWSLLKLYTAMNIEFNYDLKYLHSDVYTINVKQYLSENSGLGKDFSITYLNPETLSVHLGKYEEKYVKLIPNIIVKCRPGYQTAGKPEIDPDSIKIGGASALLSKINAIYTKTTTYNGVNANINDVVKISDSLSNILWFSREDANIHIKVELTAEKGFPDVQVKILNTPADTTVLLEPQSVNVELKGGVQQLAEIDNSKISAFIDYKTIFTDTTGAVEPKFDLPEGLVVISYKPEKIQYIIMKK